MDVRSTRLWASLARVRRLARRLLRRDAAARYDVTSLKIDPFNLPGMLAADRAGLRVQELLVDINDTCNADCVYCPNGRSPARMSLDQFRAFLDGVVEVESIQLGCGQEPTADKRLPDFLRAIQASTLRPRRVQMITNGMLLDRFDPHELRACGLDAVWLSIDTVDPAIARRIRIGTEITHMLDNVRRFRTACPEMGLVFSVVVSRDTIAGVEDVVDVGDQLGVSQYIFREVSDGPWGAPRRADYPDWIRWLALAPAEMTALADRLQHHPRRAIMHFLDSDFLDGKRPTEAIDGPVQ